jgi:hypothetical protein
MQTAVGRSGSGSIDGGHERSLHFLALPLDAN